ncbi:MAG: GNAT family N-acetyltransferase [Clostridia bacterium]|nr:GNAT family N-acetyltransferase [Clostridia bacterium]
MIIRNAEEKDIGRILELLSQVLEVHAAIRPDLFISGTTKYSADEVAAMLRDETRRTYVAADETDTVQGYAMCILRKPAESAVLVPVTTLYIDDLCVDEAFRGRQIGKALFAHVKAQAELLHCDEITLNVWEGNHAAEAFYEAMGMRPKYTDLELRLDD